MAILEVSADTHYGIPLFKTDLHPCHAAVYINTNRLLSPVLDHNAALKKNKRDSDEDYF